MERDSLSVLTSAQPSWETICQRTGLLSHGAMNLLPSSPKNSYNGMHTGATSSSPSRLGAHSASVSSLPATAKQASVPTWHLPSSVALKENWKKHQIEQHLDRSHHSKSTKRTQSVGNSSKYGDLRTTVRAKAFQDQVNEIDHMFREIKNGRPVASDEVAPTAQTSVASNPRRGGVRKQLSSDVVQRQTSDKSEGLGMVRATSEILQRRGSTVEQRSPDVPMLKYRHGNENYGLVDVQRLQARCKFMGRGYSVSKLLEHEREKSRQSRLAMVAKADLESRLDAAKDSGVPMPSKQCYDDRLFQVQQRKFENDCSTLQHKVEKSRGAYPEAAEPDAAKAIAHAAVVSEWLIY